MCHTETYIDITVNAGSANSIHAQLTQAVHFCNWHGLELGVSFPQYDDTKDNVFGNVFRVFGNIQAIYQFLPKIDEIVVTGNVTLSEISQTPKTDKVVSFIRDRSREKMTPSMQKRRARRAIERGEAPVVRQETDAPIHMLRVPSVSSQGLYNLYIRKGVPTEGGRNYGLGFAVPQF